MTYQKKKIQELAELYASCGAQSLQGKEFRALKAEIIEKLGCQHWERILEKAKLLGVRMIKEKMGL